MKKLVGLMVIILLMATVVLVRYTQAQEKNAGFSVSGTDCIGNVSPIDNGASESTINSVECTIRMEEVVIDPQDKTSHHCVAKISPLQADEKVSKVRSVDCFPTFSDAIEFATGGTATVDESINSGELIQEMLGPQGVNAATVIGIWWEHPQYSTAQGGRTWTWTTDYAPVCSGAFYAGSTMPTGWNDIVSSAHVYSNCTDFENYQHSSYGGLRIDCTPACPAMGTMNDQTSSWRIDNVIP
jgi:hypothetical protein